jgi:tetratricopeptide (TPR) repeat protein
MDDEHFQRALVLFEQSRHDLAEPEVRQALAADPDNALAHALLSICLVEREDWNAATDEARVAVRLAPDSPFSHATLARVLMDRQYVNEARESAEEARRLDPTDAETYALLSLIHTQRRDWASALQMAEQGLAHDAEHVGCNNARAMALTRLGRTAEAGKTLASALEREPENAWSHANLGWAELHGGNSKQALEHLREALRLDPTDEYAQAGLVEALQARNPIYGLMLRYFLYMSRLSGRAQWTFVIGAYVINRMLRGLARTNPQWAPWIMPLLVAYFIFVVLSWIAQPLFNLLLRLNPYGRHALSDDQRRGANLVGILGLLALICMLVWLIGGATGGIGSLGTIYFGLLLLPASAIHKCDAGWPRWCMAAYTIAIACMMPIGATLLFVNPQRAFFLFQVHLFGCLLSALVANVLIMQRAKRHSAKALG